MGLQHERDGGMIPQGIGRGVSQTPWANRVWPDVNGETHVPPTTFFVPCTQSSISSRSWFRQLMPWEEQGMAVWLPVWASLQVCSLGSRILASDARKDVMRANPSFLSRGKVLLFLSVHCEGWFYHSHHSFIHGYALLISRFAEHFWVEQSIATCFCKYFPLLIN